jgi:hypothetical protein
MNMLIDIKSKVAVFGRLWPHKHKCDNRTAKRVGKVMILQCKVLLQFLMFLCKYKQTNSTNSVALSPQANYTDWATATCRQNLVPTFMDRGGVTWSAWRILHGR